MKRYTLRTATQDGRDLDVGLSLIVDGTFRVVDGKLTDAIDALLIAGRIFYLPSDQMYFFEAHVEDDGKVGRFAILVGDVFHDQPSVPVIKPWHWLKGRTAARYSVAEAASIILSGVMNESVPGLPVEDGEGEEIRPAKDVLNGQALIDLLSSALQSHGFQEWINRVGVAYDDQMVPPRRLHHVVSFYDGSVLHLTEYGPHMPTGSVMLDAKSSSLGSVPERRVVLADWEEMWGSA